MSGPGREANRQAEAERSRREVEDRVLARAAGLPAGDRSAEAEHTREVAASIREHREMAARRRVWAAAEALGVTPAVVPSEESLAYGAMSALEWFEAYAALLEYLPRLVEHGLLHRDVAVVEATRPRGVQGMALAVETLPRPPGAVDGAPGGRPGG